MRDFFKVDKDHELISKLRARIDRIVAYFNGTENGFLLCYFMDCEAEVKRLFSKKDFVFLAGL
jgi:hypothetical protein